ncbi:MAG TPA: O-antigen ligase family protein [Kiritimatiellia bacterium]|nr:O-antigen ligase family protein [Kiritimatiellia bacterium]HRU69812.1 O-antigen ligase family protein [Kiritimatiellia bacterium]
MRLECLHRWLQTGFRWGALLTLGVAPTQWTLIDSPRLGPADLLLAATAGVWGLDILLTRGWGRLWAARPHWTHLLFTFCVGAAACTAVDRGEALKELVQIIEYFIVGTMVFTAFLHERNDRTADDSSRRAGLPLFPVLGAVTAGVLALAAWQYFTLEGHRSIARFAEPKTLDVIVNVLGGWQSPLLVGGTFGNRNVLGGFLALVLPLAAAGVLGGARGLVARGGCVLLLLAGLALTLSGAAYWAVVIVIAVMAATRGVKVFIPVALALVLWQTTVLPRLPRENDLCHFESVALYDSTGQPTRRYPEWQAAASMILTHPWLGVGPGNYQKQVGPFYGQVPNATGPAEPDIQNLYLVLGASCGLPALLAFVAVLATAAGSAVRGGRVGAAGAVAAFAAVAVWHPLLVRGIGIPLVFVLVLARHSSQEKASDGSDPV